VDSEIRLHGTYSENDWSLLAQRSTGVAAPLIVNFAHVGRAMGSYLGGCRFVGVGSVALA
jgi:hypothetical protein